MQDSGNGASVFQRRTNSHSRENSLRSLANSSVLASSNTTAATSTTKEKANLGGQGVAGAGKGSIRRSPSIQHFINKLFKKSNSSESFLPGTTSTDQITNSSAIPSPSVPTHLPEVASSTVAAKENETKGSETMGWNPEFTPVEFTPTLSVAVSPLSPPTTPSRTRQSFSSSLRRKFSLRASISTFLENNTSTQSLPQQPRRPSTLHAKPSSTNIANGNASISHERRRSKYLNDPLVLSMLDRNFEEALQNGFTSPPQTPQPRHSPTFSTTLPTKPNYPNATYSPLTEDGTLIDTEIPEEVEEEYFDQPAPNLRLPTLKELDDGDFGSEDVMTLRVTLTPAAACGTEEFEFPVEKVGKRMSGFGKLLRSRSRKVRI